MDPGAGRGWRLMGSLSKLPPSGRRDPPRVSCWCFSTCALRVLKIKSGVFLQNLGSPEMRGVLCLRLGCLPRAPLGRGFGNWLQCWERGGAGGTHPVAGKHLCDPSPRRWLQLRREEPLGSILLLCRSGALWRPGPGRRAGTPPRKWPRLSRPPPHQCPWNPGCRGQLHLLGSPCKSRVNLAFLRASQPSPLQSVPGDPSLHPRTRRVPGV